MFKRLFFAAVCACTLAIIAPTASATSLSSGTTDFKFSSGNPSDDIWVGLCMGSNLDLSQASEMGCQRKQRDLKQEGLYPYNEPNINASLCMGVSLDMTRASAARCAQHTTALNGTPQPMSTLRTKTRQTQAIITQQAPATPTFQYAALGDSVAAGTGLPRSNNQGDSICGRSTAAYPYHIAAARGFDFIHVACSGATMGSLLAQQRGQAAQLDSAFAAGTPQLITITAGANNVRWDTLLLRCLRSTCGTTSDAQSIANGLATLQTSTQAVLEGIEQRSSGSPPKVMITGYYNPVSQNCVTTQQRITSEEIAWINSQLDSLNQTLQNSAAGFGFATFVPVNFTGHDICSAVPWVQGPNDPSPLHPTAAGQQAIAQMILADP